MITNSEPTQTHPHQILEKDLLKVRCPECFKLYSVQAWDILESRPQFQCKSCTVKFWFPYPECLEFKEEFIGFPVHDSSAGQDALSPQPEKPYACPKCSTGYDGDEIECAQCGVIFSKYTEQEQRKKIHDLSAFTAAHPLTAQLPEIKDEWESVINDFDSITAHQKFIRLCQTLDAVDFAFTKYSELVQLCPQNDILGKAYKQCEAIANIRAELNIFSPPKTPLFQSENFHPKKMVHILAEIRPSTYFLIFAAIFVLIGFAVPPWRNLVGIGSSVAFLVFAIRFTK